MKYQLRARNKEGASDCFHGNTIKECLALFEFCYYRKGFKIAIYKEDELIKTIKKTFR